MTAIDTADGTSQHGGAEKLAREVRVTFDAEELCAFFDGFAPLDAWALCDEAEGDG